MQPIMFFFFFSKSVAGVSAYLFLTSEYDIKQTSEKLTITNVSWKNFFFLGSVCDNVKMMSHVPFLALSLSFVSFLFAMLWRQILSFFLLNILKQVTRKEEILPQFQSLNENHIQNRKKQLQNHYIDTFLFLQSTPFHGWMSWSQSYVQQIKVITICGE